ncbi:MAG: hypothetical protein MI757_14825 [Pirellulales bacterium]|nr:hypothetical protein [Pirellulales bacterium]
MASSIITRQLMKVRAAVLLATLVVVPLLAALGTSPERWFVRSEEPTSQNDSAATQVADATKPPTKTAAADATVPPPTTAAGCNTTQELVIRHWQQLPDPAQRSQQGRAGGRTRPLETELVEEQLRQWGATYYRLEQWGDGRVLYRFQCRMSIDDLKHYNRHFEAVAEDPVDAMHAVLEKVRVWRVSLASRTP